MNREIKESLSRNTQDLYTIRCLLHQISRVPDEGFRPMNSDAFYSNQKSLLDCLDEVKYSLNQFVAVLEAFPEKPSQSRDLESVPRIHPASNRPMVDAFKYDDQWQNTFSQITKTLRTAAKLKIEIEKFGRHRIFSKNACLDMTEVVDVLVDAEHADKLDECQRMLSSLVKELLEIIDRFGAEIDGEFSTNPLTICIEKIASRISSVDTQLLSTLPSGAHEETFAHEFTASLNQVVHDCLITVQNVYKNHVNNTMEKSKDNEHNGTEEEEKFVLEDDHVKEKISERLSADIDNFKIKNVCLQLKQLLFKLSRSGNSADIDQCARATTSRKTFKMKEKKAKEKEPKEGWDWAKAKVKKTCPNRSKVWINSKMRNGLRNIRNRRSTKIARKKKKESRWKRTSLVNSKTWKRKETMTTTMKTRKKTAKSLIRRWAIPKKGRKLSIKRYGAAIRRKKRRTKIWKPKRETRARKRLKKSSAPKTTTIRPVMTIGPTIRNGGSRISRKSTKWRNPKLTMIKSTLITVGIIILPGSHFCSYDVQPY
ncbi:unnamed protein product [Nesidiocoris tenuis]|uniref:Uncharacterized protein n=1 Tax=Nesidiocoris tenuis TaxID=355587 RepID=A0A6H5HNR4_9HEMI|nr:unnamed protein product [Nesidiocoris tenuis]